MYIQINIACSVYDYKIILKFVHGTNQYRYKQETKLLSFCFIKFNKSVLCLDLLRLPDKYEESLPRMVVLFKFTYVLLFCKDRHFHSFFEYQIVSTFIC